MIRTGVEIPVLRHGQFDGPGAQRRNYANFVASLTEESRKYPLTLEGRNQIRRTWERIPNRGEIDVVYVSEFLRTKQSGEVVVEEVRRVSGRQVEMVETSLVNTVYMPPDTLSEREFDLLEGTGKKNAVAEEMFLRWSRGETGETPKMLGQRISQFLEVLQHAINEGWVHPMVVTHSSFASAMQRWVGRTDLTKPRNEEEILQVSGFYYLQLGGERELATVGTQLFRESYLRMPQLASA